jgi:hypothetical protein
VTSTEDALKEYYWTPNTPMEQPLLRADYLFPGSTRILRECRVCGFASPPVSPLAKGLLFGHKEE